MTTHKTEGRFRVEVIADNSGQYAGNALRFDTVTEGIEYANGLAARWTLVRAWRVVDGNDETSVASSSV